MFYIESLLNYLCLAYLPKFKQEMNACNRVGIMQCTVLLYGLGPSDMFDWERCWASLTMIGIFRFRDSAVIL